MKLDMPNNLVQSFLIALCVSGFDRLAAAPLQVAQLRAP